MFCAALFRCDFGFFSGIGVFCFVLPSQLGVHVQAQKSPTTRIKENFTCYFGMKIYTPLQETELIFKKVIKWL